MGGRGGVAERKKERRKVAGGERVGTKPRSQSAKRTNRHGQSESDPRKQSHIPNNPICPPRNPSQEKWKCRMRTTDLTRHDSQGKEDDKDGCIPPIWHLGVSPHQLGMNIVLLDRYPPHSLPHCGPIIQQGMHKDTR